MKEFKLHIRYLIQKHDCVILPGIGAFLAHQLPARIDAETGYIFPTRRRIWFNPHIRLTDGLLAHSIARREGISYEEGAELAERFCAETAALLSHGANFEIPGVGTLCGNADSESLSFLPSLCSPYPDLGLRKAAEQGQKRAIRAFNTHKYYYLPLNKTFTQVAASIALVLGVAFALVLPNKANIERMQQASVITTITNAAKTATKMEVTPIESPKPVVAQPTPQVEATQAPDTYYLVVAAAKTDAELEKFKTQHSGTSYDLRKVPAKGIGKLYAASGNDRAALLETLNSNEFKAEYGTCWIYELKK